MEDYGEAARLVLARIDSGVADANGIGSTRDITIVGHRVVHGGYRYSGPVLIDEGVIQYIEKLADLAPLHNASASVIRASRAVIGDKVPEVAVFDTAFHRTIPDHARFYAIPWELTQRHRIQCFGFHSTTT